VRKDIVTEKQRIAAIDALAEELLFRWKRSTFCGYSTEAKECLRTRTIKQLRTLHEDGNLNAKDVYEFLITGYWHNATEEQKLKCENAVQAMKEILKEETN
jgi:GTP1/Obg family GTP-binding protein